MLNRLTVSSLIQSVIVLMSTCMMALLCVSAWDSWQRLTVTGRISVVADASSNLFKAMHNLRSDRASTIRSLNDDALVQPDIGKYLRDSRDAEMPAMRAAAAVLDDVEFADQKTLVPELTRLIQTMTALEAESWDAMHKPKPSRRPAIAKEYAETAASLLETMDKVSVRLAAAVNHSDAVTDQLLMIKQVAWLLRNAAGETSLMISVGLGAGHVAPDAHQTYTKYVGRIEAAWNALETVAAGTQLPPRFVEAMAEAKTAYFDPQYLALRDRLLNALVTGEKPEMTANQWSPYTVGRMIAAVTVAERALDAAREYTMAQHSLAKRSLALQLVLLASALALTVGTMIAVTRRVIRPLHTMRDAMLKVAAGDLTVDTGYAQRRDEIGALWPARWKPSSNRPPTSSGSKRRNVNATPAPPRASAASKPMSVNSRASCARRWTN
jgi:HAMP domain-containing protein